MCTQHVCKDAHTNHLAIHSTITSHLDVKTSSHLNVKTSSHSMLKE